MRILLYGWLACTFIVLVWMVSGWLLDRAIARRLRREKARRAARCANGDHREILMTASILAFRCIDCWERRHVGTVWYGATNKKPRRVA
jgi:hypothetical protein